MTNAELLREITSLPESDRNKIESFVSLLKEKQKTSRPESGKKSLRDEPAFGMWKDREDMRDSVEWVRNIRRTHWRQRNS